MELVAEVFESAYLIALTITGDSWRAAGALEEATLKAWRGFDGFDRGMAFKSWFLRVLARECLTRGWAVDPSGAGTGSRTEADRAPIVKGAAARGPAPLTVMDGFGCEDTLRAVRALPVTCRAATALKLVENLSYAEIALVLDIPVGDARLRIHRARRMLLNRLVAHAAGPGRPPQLS